MLDDELRLYYAKQRLEKAWTDAARLASAEARKQHAKAAKEMAGYHHEAAKGSGPLARYSSPEFASGHKMIAHEYDRAAAHFEGGNTKEGFLHFHIADDMWGHPSAYLSDLRDSIVGAAIRLKWLPKPRLKKALEKARNE